MSYSDDYVSVDLAVTFVILDTLNIFWLIDWLIDFAASSVWVSFKFMFLLIMWESFRWRQLYSR